MTDPGDRRPLDRLGNEIDRARRDAGLEAEDQEGQAPPAGELGMAWRVSIEMVVALVLCTGLGWVIDQWVGTTPWVMLVMLFLGAGAGIRNAVRTLNRMDALALERTQRAAGADGAETKTGGRGGG